MSTGLITYLCVVIADIVLLNIYRLNSKDYENCGVFGRLFKIRSFDDFVFNVVALIPYVNYAILIGHLSYYIFYEFIWGVILNKIPKEKLKLPSIRGIKKDKFSNIDNMFND